LLSVKNAGSLCRLNALLCNKFLLRLELHDIHLPSANPSRNVAIATNTVKPYSLAASNDAVTALLLSLFARVLFEVLVTES